MTETQFEQQGWAWPVIPYNPPTLPATSFGRPYGNEFSIQIDEEDCPYPKVVLSSKAHGKMLALIQECQIEISWLSSVSILPSKDFQIDDVYVPLQSCSAASTNISEEGEAELLTELLSKNKGSEIAKLKCWGHSHVNMAVVPSQTDEVQTQTFINRWDHHMIRFIGNKQGELLTNVYLKDEGVTLNDPPLVITDGVEDYTEWAIQQIKEKVSRAVFQKPVKPKKWRKQNGLFQTYPTL